MRPSKVKNLVGQRFNMLVVQSLHEVTKDYRAVWLCICDCGNITKVRSSNLPNGSVKSCGCLRENKETQGVCRYCKVKLTLETSYPSTVEKGNGLCKKCAQQWCIDHPENVKISRKKKYDTHKQKLNQDNQIRNRTLSGRFDGVKRFLREESIPETDLLHSFNFYCELIKDLQCHYCYGPLSPTSHALDRMENSLGHVCYNVVPCCRKCNSIKSDSMTYAQMMLLVPGLREIRKQNSLVQHDPSTEERATQCVAL